jgi:hypothetical protein
MPISLPSPLEVNFGPKLRMVLNQMIPSITGDEVMFIIAIQQPVLTAAL